MFLRCRLSHRAVKGGQGQHQGHSRRHFSRCPLGLLRVVLPAQTADRVRICVAHMHESSPMPRIRSPTRRACCRVDRLTGSKDSFLFAAQRQPELCHTTVFVDRLPGLFGNLEPHHGLLQSNRARSMADLLGIRTVADKTDCRDRKRPPANCAPADEASTKAAATIKNANASR